MRAGEKTTVMTYRWLTCFSLVVSAAAGASLSGVVSLVDSKEPSVRKKKDYSGVVVWLEPVNGAGGASPGQIHTILQKGKRFTPHVSVITAGTTVDFPNLDPIFHNAFSNFAGQPFDTGLYAPGTTQKIRFRREGIVRVFCNIHSMMSAVIVVLETPWFATTGADGRFRIENVPAGEYQMKVWHERSPEPALKALARRVRLNGGETTLEPIVISESGYLELPHKNKYGRDYPREPGASVTYSGLGR